MSISRLLSACLLLFTASFALAGDRLLATGGAVSIEGTSGGGITPWATLAGYGTDGQFGCAAAVSRLSLDDFELDTLGGACSWDNRLELSLTRQQLDLGGLRPVLGLPDKQMLRQRIAGLKIRLHGDLVYDRFGQWSAGLKYKDSEDSALARVAGADSGSGTEAYLSVARLFIDGLFERYTFVNATLRASNANQGGLLGFGGNTDEPLHIEFAAAWFARRDLAIGFEYRQKPDQLDFASEDDWRDLFVAWFPSKHVSVVAAWAELGSIGGLEDQSGLYVSLAGSF